jgi:hypothetical protein
MKTILIFIVLMLSTLSFAMAASPNHCDGADSCVKGKIPLIKSGTYYARGHGSTCEEAMEDSQIQFDRIHGKMECGIFAGPVAMGCSKICENQYSSWAECSPGASGPKKPKRSACRMIGPFMVC